MDKNKQTLTSVKVKVSCVRHKFSFQKLADRAIHMYLTDDDFRKSVHSHNNLDLK